ncbi:MAG: acetylornithine deacetylase [Sphingomonadales bacterium]|jgi:acetylornithine deacetylase
MSILDQTLKHLGFLVGCNTQNPPRAIKPKDPIFSYISEKLGVGWDIKITNHGKGRVTFFAKRGNPNTLFNVHLDTVPFGEGWSNDPQKLIVHDKKAYGRGACDIKGAAATLMSLAENTKADMALLFTTDEEGTEGCCVNKFCEGINFQEFKLVVVAEPTGMKAVLGHRGYLSVEGQFEGCSGHTSNHNSTKDSALHDLTHWSSEALKLAEESGEGRLSNNRFNIGRIDGGIKPNMVANRAKILWSMRPASGSNPQNLFNEMTKNSNANWTINFSAPSLPAIGQKKTTPKILLGSIGVDIGDDVAFWTEAALFSEANFPAIVLGPGHIEQAHTVDEWVEIEQLELAYQIYGNILESKQ